MASGSRLTAALPFIGATTLIAALPLLWLINIGACAVFIALIVF